MMRRNRLRELLDEGDRPLFGAFMNSATPRQVEFMGLVGFDWVVLDAEHDGLTLDRAYDLLIAADAVGLGTAVRTPANAADLVLGFAEAGANMIISAHVTSAAEAESLVSSLSYPPRGTRGLAIDSRAANYGLTQTPAEYFGAKTHAIAAPLLEDASAYDDLDAMLAIPEIDVFMLGLGDLSGSLGVPGDLFHPEVQSRVSKATAAILGAGKVILSSAPNAEGARAAADAGHRLIVTSNSNLLATASRDFLQDVRGR